MASFLSPCRFKASIPHFSISISTRTNLRVTHLSFQPRVATRMFSLRFGSNSMNQQPSESDPNSKPQNDAVKADNSSGSNEVLVQYVVLRRDLIDTWPLGSVVTQGCHASVSAVWSHRDDPHTIQYCSPENIDSMHKVTLEVKGEAQMFNLSEKLTAGGIDHKLWIEQPENVPTCLATKPYPKSVLALYFKKLKLCK